MRDFSAIDITRLPPLDIVERVDFETELAAISTELKQRWPEFSALLESEPAIKLLQVLAYAMVILRERVNQAARACTLAYATGHDLDHLAANFNVRRLVIAPGEPTAIPPRPAVYEPDDDLRRRVQLAFEGLSTAGPEGAYIFHGLSAHPDVLDISATSPAPMQVLISVLSRSGDGNPSPEVLAAVNTALNAEDVRPLTDQVSVQAASIIEYQIHAALTMLPGPDAELALMAANRNLDDYIARHQRLGKDVTRSGLFAALHVPGVHHVVLHQPATDLPITPLQSARCTQRSVTLAGTDE